MIVETNAPGKKQLTLLPQHWQLFGGRNSKQGVCHPEKDGGQLARVQEVIEKDLSRGVGYGTNIYNAGSTGNLDTDVVKMLMKSRCPHVHKLALAQRHSSVL